MTVPVRIDWRRNVGGEVFQVWADDELVVDQDVDDGQMIGVMLHELRAVSETLDDGVKVDIAIYDGTTGRRSWLRTRYVRHRAGPDPLQRWSLRSF